MNIQRREFLQSMTAIVSAPLLFHDEAPIVIKPGVPQLFIDDFLIAEEKGLKRTLHQPKKDDGGNVPVIELKDEFGEFAATLEANGTIIYDTRLNKWVMF